MNDPHSAANFHAIRTVHISIDWKLSFIRKTLAGQVKLSMERERGLSGHSLEQIVLDCSVPAIRAIRSVTVNETNCEHYLVNGASNSPGQLAGSFTCDSLVIKLEGSLQLLDLFVVAIEYEIDGGKSSAMQWLTAADGSPFLFTQCQAIHARSLLPCQDTPSVKASYDAKVSIVDEKYADLTVLMSAVRVLPSEDSIEDACINGQEKNQSSQCNADSTDVTNGSILSENSTAKQHAFKQAMAIPSYLIALVAGRLEERIISPRCSVWAEPHVADAAHAEFAPDTEAYLRHAEDIAGPYLWNRYDLLVLPSSFPYGGMENPCLTFLTPSLLAGDGSLTDVVAHEISHSWTGNLVTACNWEHFWLNEGCTMYLERLILGRHLGEPYRQFDALLGQGELSEDVDFFESQGKHGLSVLVPDLSCADPDDAFSRVPYEKGFSLLYALECTIGRNAFESFFHAYIQHFAHRSISTEQWYAYLQDYCRQNCPPEVQSKLAAFDFDAFLKKPGHLPTCMPPFSDRSLIEVCECFAEKLLSAAKTTPSSSSVASELRTEFNALFAKQQMLVLDLLSKKSASGEINTAMLDNLDSILQLTSTPTSSSSSSSETTAGKACSNVEIVFRWIMLALRNGYTKAVPMAKDFVLRHGRMKYCRPVFRALAALDASMAKELFNANRNKYHPIAIMMIERDMASSVTNQQ